MAEIHYKQLSDHLDQMGTGGGVPEYAAVYLIYGEEFLCKTAFKTLLSVLIPEGPSSINYEPVSNSESEVAEAVQKMTTFSLIPGRKVVSLLDCQIFHSRRDTGKILEAGRKAFENDNLKKASRHVLKLLALLDLSFDDVDRSDKVNLLSREMAPESSSEWLESTIRYCRERGFPIPRHQDNDQILTSALEKGFPRDNFLILTVDIVDKRRRLFKLISQKGTVIDCSVPKGARKADRIVQESVLAERMASILEKAGKTADRPVLQTMIDMTGFDLRTFAQNLEKLINYAGDRPVITRSDVESVLKRSKKDPLYEFTNAVTDRNLDRAVFYMESLLKDSSTGHPLQLLAAVVNQMRKLLVIRAFMDGDQENRWYPGCPYNIFQSRVMPAIQLHDKALSDQTTTWQPLHSADDKTDLKGKKRKAKKKKPVVATDLMIAKNPRNAYPVYQMFKKTERFTKDELVGFIQNLSQTDHLLKTSGRNPKYFLEKVVFSICIS